MIEFGAHAPNTLRTRSRIEVRMSEKIDDAALNALKIAFTYMPKSIEVTRYEYGDRYQTVLEHIEAVREILLLNDVDPEEVYGEINPSSTPNSTY
jgi:hypothetical protein